MAFVRGSCCQTSLALARPRARQTYLCTRGRSRRAWRISWLPCCPAGCPDGPSGPARQAFPKLQPSVSAGILQRDPSFRRGCLSLQAYTLQALQGVRRAKPGGLGFAASSAAATAAAAPCCHSSGRAPRLVSEQANHSCLEPGCCLEAGCCLSLVLLDVQFSKLI